MDNLTHSLVGLFLARAGFRHVSPRATAILIVAANMPDIDTLSWLGGFAASLRWHRHLTHSLVAIPFMALLAIVLVRLLGRRQIRWLPAFGIALLGVASHIILDLTNVYGVRLMLPWSGAWTHWDTVPVVDFTIWAILLLGVLAPFLSRLVNSEIGMKERSVGAGWAILSLLLLIGYDWARRDLHENVLGQLQSRTYNGLGARRVGAFPRMNPLDWDGAVELSYGYILATVTVRERFDPSRGLPIYKAERTPLVLSAMATDPFQHMQEFVIWPVWSSEPIADGGTRVTLTDIRFGRPNQSAFTAEAILSKNGQIRESKLAMGAFRPK